MKAEAMGPAIAIVVGFTSWISRRDTTLQLYDPDALREMDDDIMAAWSEDIDTRLNGLEHESPTGRNR